MKTLYLSILIAAGLCTLGVSNACAQTPVDSEEENFRSVTSFGVTTNTNSGILGGFVFRQSKLLPGELLGKQQYRYISVEVVNVKHPKEVSSSLGFAGSRFTSGKQNYLFVIRPQYGRELALFKRSSDEGIAINAIFAAGPSLGIIKPYYVQVQSGSQVRTVPYQPNNGAGSGLDQIVGAGSFFQGFGQSKFTVGVNVKAAASFELSAFRNNTTGVEIGFLTELFSQKVPIMAFDENRAFFTSGYVTLFFGSKK